MRELLIHAEINAIFAITDKTLLMDSTVYVTVFPCLNCSLALIQVHLTFSIPSGPITYTRIIVLLYAYLIDESETSHLLDTAEALRHVTSIAT